MKIFAAVFFSFFCLSASAECSLNESQAITKFINWIHENLNSSFEYKYIDDPKFCRLIITFNYWGRKHEVEYLAINNIENKIEPIFYNDVKFVDLNWESNKTLRTKPLEDEYPNKLILAKDGKEMIWNPGGLFGKPTKIKEAEYIKSVKNGIEKIWYGSGKLKSESPFLDGELSGIEKAWDESGTLLSEKKYKNGILASGSQELQEDNENSTNEYFDKRKKELAKETAKEEVESKNKAEIAVKARQTEESLQKDRIIKAKIKCIDLGFASNTDKHAKCVLELIR
jgi:hypothetical protein